MSKSKNTQAKTTSAPAEVSAAAVAQTPAQAPTQEQTGASQATEAINAAPVVDDAAGDVKRLGYPTHVVVTAMKDGFRRAGRAWSKEPTMVAIADFTDEQLQALATEPMLTVALIAE